MASRPVSFRVWYTSCQPWATADRVNGLRRRFSCGEYEILQVNTLATDGGGAASDWWAEQRDFQKIIDIW